MTKLSSRVLLFLLATLAVQYSVCQNEAEIIPEVSHPPHLRATLERPEVHLNEELERKAIQFTEHISQEAGDIADKIKETVTGVKETVGSKKDALKGKVHKMEETVSDKARNVKESVKKTMHNIKDTVKQIGEEVLEKIPYPHKRALEDKTGEFVETLSEGGIPRKGYTEEVKHVVKKRVHWTERIANFKDSVSDWLKYFFFGKPYTYLETDIRKKEAARVKPVEVEHITEKFEEAGTKGAEKLEEEKERVKETIKEGAEKLGQKARGAEEVIIDSIQIGDRFQGGNLIEIKEIKESAKGAVSEIGSKLEEVKEGWQGFADKFHVARDRINNLPIEKYHEHATVNEVHEDYHLKYEYSMRRTVKPMETIRREIIPTH